MVHRVCRLSWFSLQFLCLLPHDPMVVVLQSRFPTSLYQTSRHLFWLRTLVPCEVTRAVIIVFVFKFMVFVMNVIYSLTAMFRIGICKLLSASLLDVSLSLSIVRPKSLIFTVSFSVIKQLRAAMSRCTKFFSCDKYRIPSAAWQHHFMRCALDISP